SDELANRSAAGGRAESREQRGARIGYRRPEAGLDDCDPLVGELHREAVHAVVQAYVHGINLQFTSHNLQREGLRAFFDELDGRAPRIGNEYRFPIRTSSAAVRRVHTSYLPLQYLC